MSVSNYPLSGGRKLLASIPAPSPSVAEHTERSTRCYVNEGTLNSDLAVILSVMICGLICMLGLNSLFRCVLCFRRRNGADSSDEVAIRLANTGLKKTAMKALPIVEYRSANSKLPAGLATECPSAWPNSGKEKRCGCCPIVIIDSTWNALINGSIPILRALCVDIPSISSAKTRSPAALRRFLRPWNQTTRCR